MGGGTTREQVQERLSITHSCDGASNVVCLLVSIPTPS